MTKIRAQFKEAAGKKRNCSPIGLFPPPPPPPPPPTSHELQFISVTSGFTRLSMKTKYVCRGLISL